MEKNIDIAENDAKQYIVVKIGSEQYGIDISYIDNIVRMQKITRFLKSRHTLRALSIFVVRLYLL